jgi:hypothetical protein
MTEAEWLRCTTVREMVAHLPSGLRTRQVRLFACACCRRIGDLLGDHWCCRAIDIVEGFVDGNATETDWEAAERELLRAIDATRDQHPYPDYLIRPEHAARWAVRWLLARGNGGEVINTVSFTVVQASGLLALVTTGGNSRRDIRDVRRLAEAQERDRQCRLLRDIVGNPFRPVVVDPCWLTWREDTVPKIAQAVYQERAFDRLPILADALEDAGCTNEEVLKHCREPGEHVRGCWVVDLLSGRNSGG